MIDLKRLRDEPAYRAGIERKRVRAGLLDELIAADDARRALLTEVEELRARQNAASKEIGKAAPDDRPAKIAAAGALKEELAAREPDARRGRGRGARARARGAEPGRPRRARRRRGRGRRAAHRRRDHRPAPALDHATFAEAMGFVDAERGAEVGGSRFAYVMREAVLLELALVQWVMGLLVSEGFVPVVPPVLVREHVMEEAGFFPTDRNQVYDLPEDELFLVGTSEVPLSALHRGDLLDAAVAAAAATPGSPRTSGARRARTARTRAASSACTSSTRSRCSPTSRRPTPRPSTSGSSRSRSASSAASACRTAW